MDTGGNLDGHGREQLMGAAVWLMDAGGTTDDIVVTDHEIGKLTQTPNYPTYDDHYTRLYRYQMVVTILDGNCMFSEVS